jgi:hypothetical protein
MSDGALVEVFAGAVACCGLGKESELIANPCTMCEGDCANGGYILAILLPTASRPDGKLIPNVCANPTP